MEIGKRILDKIYNIDIKVYPSMFEEVNRLKEMIPHLTIYLSICRVQKSGPLVFSFVYIFGSRWLSCLSTIESIMFVCCGSVSKSLIKMIILFIIFEAISSCSWLDSSGMSHYCRWTIKTLLLWSYSPVRYGFIIVR